MCVSPRNLLIQASLTMVMMPSWCGTTLILIIRFRPLSIVFLWMVHSSKWWLMTVVVSKNILKFHFITKEELKLKEELPWLSRTSTLEIIPSLDVNWLEAFCTWYKVQCSLLWQVGITEITINNQIIISNVFNSYLSYYWDLEKVNYSINSCKPSYNAGLKVAS